MAADLEFRIGAELTEIKGALAGLQRDLQNVGNAARTAGGNDAFRGVQQSAQGAIGTLGRLAAGFVTVAGLIRAIGAADQINTLNARLQLVTRSTEEFARAQQALFDLSQRTRSDLSETIGLYTQIANATRDANVGQEVLLEVVETINQAVQLSGTSAQAAQAALVQLGQGLASGTLRGEELNSILEQTPALAQAIADGLGITRGELRRYGEEGRITAQAVIEALQRQRDTVNQQFQTLPLTVGQAVTQLRNAGTRLLGVFNETSGATSGLAQAIADFAAFIQSDQVIGAVIEFTDTWSRAFADIAQDASDAIAIIRGATTDLVGDGRDAVSILTDAFLQLPRNLRTVVRIVTTVFAGLVDSIVADATLAKEAIAAIFTDDTIDAAIARRNARVNASLQTVRELIAEEVDANRQAVAASQRLSAEAEARRRASSQRTGNTSQGNFRTNPSAAQQQQAQQIAKAQLDAQEKLQEDSSARQLRTLEQQFDDGLLAAAAYYQRRQEIELAGIDRAIAVERQRTQAGGAERVKALAEIELLERRKTDVIAQAERDRAEFRRNLERQLADLRVQELQADGNTAEAARLQAEAKFADLRRALLAEGDAAGVALIDRLINTAAADARLQELQRKVSDAVGNLRSQEGLISAQVDAGLLPAITGEEQLQAAREAGIAQLQQYLQVLREIAAAQVAEGGIASPQVVEAIRATETEIARATAAQRTFQNQAQQAGQSALQGLFTDLATGARSFGDAVRAAALAFVQSLARMAAEALAKRAILSLIGGPGGGFLAGIFHSGGIVGQGAPSRMVNPLLFAGAPRYHSGGMVGLKPDERPAILQTGEEVLSRSDPRNAANGGGAGGGTRIINVIDPAMVSDYLASSSGEKTILNVLQRNSGAVRQVLA